MYAENGIFFPNTWLETQQLEDYWKSQKSNDDPMSQSVAEYDLGGESDLFKAPEPIIEEEPSLDGVDPMMTAAMAMMSCGEEGMTNPQGLDLTNLESIQSEQQLLDECERDFLVKAAKVSPFPEVRETEKANYIQETREFSDVPFQKSVSCSDLSWIGRVTPSAVTPEFVDFPMIDFGGVYGMRRVFSEGDIQTLSTRDIGLLQFSLHLGGCTMEDRREKLSRYRIKKSRRNFGRKIKYACRKALADSQPRIRGRFAKTEGSSHVIKRRCKGPSNRRAHNEIKIRTQLEFM